MKKLKYIQLFAFLVIVGGLSIGSFVAKDREFSDNENRYLAKPPKLSIEKILDCSFQDEAEEYLKDQVCLRDGWITVKTTMENLCRVSTKPMSFCWTTTMSIFLFLHPLTIMRFLLQHKSG